MSWLSPAVRLPDYKNYISIRTRALGFHNVVCDLDRCWGLMTAGDHYPVESVAWLICRPPS